MTLLKTLCFLVGTSFGSFANVCIYRIPRQISVVSLRSFCPHCRSTLKWYEILPVVSFVLLRGKCKSCRKRISFRYPVIELVSGTVFLYLFAKSGVSIDAVSQSVLFLLLLITGSIDWTNLVIPNKIVVSGLVVGAALFFSISYRALFDAFLSAVLAGSAMYVVRGVGNALFRKETMGLGDIKLSILIGFFVGISSFLVAVWLAAFVGCLYWGTLRLLGRATSDAKLPFGSFLSLTSFLVLSASNNPLFH